MDFEEEFELEHILLAQRTCRTCGKTKDLIDGFYRTRKDRGSNPGAFSYECRNCTIMRVTANRMANRVYNKWEYPDW